MPPIKVEMRQEGEWQRVMWKGPINEEAKAILKDLSGKLGPRCVFDFEGVSFLNSSGIRDWSYFIRDAKLGRELVYDRCPDEVVQSMNMVMSFGAHLDVRSVLRSYICIPCDREQVETLTLGRDYVRGAKPPKKLVACQSCHKAMEPLEGDEEFFLFLDAPATP